MLLGFNEPGTTNPSLFLGTPSILLFLDVLLIVLLPLDTDFSSGLQAGEQCLVHRAILLN